MEKTIAVLVILCLLMPFLSAEAIFIRFDMDKNDAVSLTALDVGEGWRGHFREDAGSYRIAVLDAGGKEIDALEFEPTFILLSDPPQPIDYSTQSFRLNYSDSADALVITHEDAVIFRKKLPERGICSGNRICEEGENAFGCLSDCRPSPEMFEDEYDLGGLQAAPAPFAAMPICLGGAVMLLICAAIALYFLKLRKR